MENIKNIKKIEFNKALESNFTKSPNEIIIKNSMNLKDLEKFIFITLLSFNNEDIGQSFTNIKSLSKIIYNKYNETTRKEISKILNCLKSKGLIEIEISYKFNRDVNRTIPINSYKIVKSINIDKSWDMIPNFLIMSNKFTWKEKLFAVQIYHFVYITSNKISFSNKQIANKLKIDSRKVSKYINTFIKKGILITNEYNLEINFFALFDISKDVQFEMLKTISELRDKVDKYENKVKEIKQERDKYKKLYEQSLEEKFSIEEISEDEINQPYLN